jgi:type IV secretory pathway TraG/TraD family ATPase VirD4
LSARSPRPVGDPLVNVGLLVVVAAFALVLLLRGVGTVAAWLTGLPLPTAGVTDGLGVLASPLDPGAALGAAGLNPFLYWVLVLGALAVVLVSAIWVWRVARNARHGRADDPERLAGTATASEIAAAASSRQLKKNARTYRPSLERATPSDVGYLLGRARGREVWATVEDSVLLIGPPRSGKGLHIVINMILDAPGAVVTTSTRPDNLAVTMEARRAQGRPVAVFDPQRLAPGVPAGLRWSPVRGCEDPLTAMIRATGLAAGIGFGGVENGGFWEGKARMAIQALLHAAALDGRDASSVYQWSQSPTSAADAVRVLQSRQGAAGGWAESLEAMIQSDPRTRDSIWHGIGLAFGALADPRVLAAVTPTERDAFDPAEFLTEKGTLFLLATGAGASASGALVSAFIEDLVEVARRLASRSPGARLDPPLLLALDEIGNLATIPSLPTLMAEGGGSGITTVPVLQSLAQARQKWSENAAHAIWDAAIVKIVLGGASASRDLHDLSELIGERDEETESVTRDYYGAHSAQRSLRRVPILAPNALRTLPFGTGMILLRSAPPIVTRLRPWTARRDVSSLTTQRERVEAILQHSS